MIRNFSLPIRSSSAIAKGVLFAIDTLAISVIALLLCAGVPGVAYAYVDPSIMTYTIQALAGVAVALSAVLGVAWRRLRRKIYKKLNIDENAGKLVEADVHQIDPETDKGKEQLKEADKVARESALVLDIDHQQNRKWLPRFVIALIASLFLIYTVGIVAPIEIIANGASSLQFGLVNVISPLVLFAVICVLVLSFGISAIRGKAFNIVVGIVFAVGVCCYLQAAFMNSGLPLADGRPVPWDDYTTITFVTGLIWILIIVIVVLIAVKNGNLLKASTAIVSVVLILIQSIGLATLFINPTLRSDGSSFVDAQIFPTTEGLNEVSSKNNIVLFVLDTFDNDYMDAAIEDDPQILDPFTGFTWFRDSSGSMIPTPYGLPSMITGRELTDSDDGISPALLSKWYDDYNILDALSEDEYSVDLYTAQYAEGVKPLERKSNNFSYTEGTAPFEAAVANLWKCALYRDMPWVLKPPFWFYTGTINTEIFSKISGSSSDALPYTNDDVLYYQQLKSNGLEISDERAGDSGSFKLIHLDGTHLPWNVNENVERVPESETNVAKQAEASLKIVAEYIAQLKELGIYDDTAIIVSADHGKWLNQPDIVEPSSPITLIKPWHEGAAQYDPIKVSYAPITHYDLAPTIAQLIGEDPDEFGSGVSIFDVPVEPRLRKYYDTNSVHTDKVRWMGIQEWEIDGNVQDWDSWRKTEKYWPNLDN